MPAKTSRKPSRTPKAIRLRGVRQNNLKNIDVDIPLGKYVVVTGLSGAGKSSLVFDTLHAEGQRRYVETFSAYTRQFLDLLEKPDLDSAENVRPSIAIEQKNTVKTSRSTVGTMTELCDFFKVWFSHAATLFDPATGEPIRDDNPKTAWEKARAARPGETVLLAFPVKKPAKLAWESILANVRAQGYARFAAPDGSLRRVDDDGVAAALEAAGAETAFVLQDRLALEPANRARFLEAAETAFEFGQGVLQLLAADGAPLETFSRGLRSPATGRTFRPAAPPLFSFNSPIGACPKCRGFGRVIEIDYRLAIPDESRSIAEGAIKPFEGQVYGASQRDLLRACKRLKISATKPFRDLSERERDLVIRGEPAYRDNPEEVWERHRWYGLKGFFSWLETQTYKMHARVFLSRYRAYTLCPDCQGARLQPEALCWKWRDRRLPDLYQMPVAELLPLMESAEESADANDAGESRQATHALEAIVARLGYLERVGLGYLSLDRQARTLSGGEVERVNLTSCLGAALVDTLFALDEPSVGLHPRDIDRLIRIIRSLVDAGNTVVVVEHDEALIQAADHAIEIGPEPGADGGRVTFQGSLPQLRRSRKSLTGRYLSGALVLDPPERPRPARPGKDAPALRIRQAAMRNLQGLDLDLPLQRFVCLSGVSGSGKSTLLKNVVLQNLLAQRGRPAEDPAPVDSLESDLDFAEILMVDQSPASRSPRSNPAVFVEAWEAIRKLYGSLPEAQAQGFTASSFSFNAGDGRCEPCKGLGYERVEMQFLSDVYVPCPHCNGSRFKEEVKAVAYRSRSVADLLEMTVDEARSLFEDKPKIRARLDALEAVGLGYLRMGQPLNTLSGGESQRLKLVRYLPSEVGGSGDGGPSAPGALILLDEPTTGLHKSDVKRLLEVLQSIVRSGHSLVVIEHQLDVLKSADWLVELGPGAGAEGGQLVFEGPPARCAARADTETGRYLAPLFPDARPEAPALAAAEAPAAYRSGPDIPNGSAEPPLEVAQTRALTVVGAREHNLKNITVSIPRYSFTVVTGVSGSGKSTLAFDIVFGEGQRRFMESMSPYARQFVEQLPRPDVDRLSGIQPAVAIEQRVTRGTRKSTVATITEVAQYLRLLYSRIGVPHNPDTGKPLVAQDERQLLDRLRSLLASPEAASAHNLLLFAPLARSRKGHHQPIATWIADRGYEIMRVDGEVIFTDDFEKLDRYREHDIEVAIADLKPHSPDSPEVERRLKEALQRGKGTCFLADDTNRILGWLSARRADLETGEALPELDPKDFSFNSSRGWCPTCRGHGRLYAWMRQDLDDQELLAKSIGAESGEDEEDGALCPDCRGERLNRASRHVKLYLKNGDALSLPQLLRLPPAALLRSLDRLQLDRRGQLVARDIVLQIRERLQFLDKVGLEYLSLDRATQTLSGGEAQRIRLAAQLGSNLAGALYTLDEPSIGLHAQDGERLIATLKQLQAKGNTLLVVEHDEAIMAAADRIIDLGPGAGTRGGEVIAEGAARQLVRNRRSLTGQYLKTGIAHPLNGGRRALPSRRAGSEAWLQIDKVAFRNLSLPSVRLPLQRLVMLCGPSGAGKSSLARDLLVPAARLAIKTKRSRLSGAQFAKEGPAVEGAGRDGPLFASLSGANAFRAVIEVDQSPIGKTPRSTPATYLGAFDLIRQFFASLPESKIRGYSPGRFSFNTPKGRCPTCNGSGRLKLEMSFMPDTYVTCEDCAGRRYGPDLLEIRWRGKSVADVLEMTFEEAADFFDFHSQLTDTMRLMNQTGLGYLALGQSSPTLSGGEAQRLKLVSELAKGLQTRVERSRGIARRNLYVLEEPTIGLHLSDCEKLIRLLHGLVDQGHTVLVVEHHLDLLAEADYLVELGPGGGPKGGKLLYQGAPPGLLKSKRSVTRPYLAGKVEEKGKSRNDE